MALYNLKNPAVKRLMKEAEELRFPTEEYYAQPLEDNLFEWHFTLRGPPNTEFDSGIYHGRITLPPEYPMKPPSIILLTPNGRFEINKKICLSISGHHPESWQPSWSIRTALLAIIGFLPTHGNGAIGSLDYTPEERKNLAEKSQNWKCSDCGYIKDFLKKDGESHENTTKVLEELKPQKETEIVEDSPSATADLLPEKINLNHENQSDDKMDKLLLNGAKVHSKHIPHYENMPASSDQDSTFPRHRLLNPNQEKQTVEPETSENKIVKSDKVKHVSNYYSLFVIWVLVVILVILIARRLLYQ